MDAPVTGPPNRASRPTVPPIAIAAAAPTARVSVATAMITNIRMARQHALVDEGAADADRGNGRAEIGRLARPDGQQQQSAASVAPMIWAADVGGRLAAGEVAA